MNGRLRLRQPAAGYRAAIDPVFLAAAVPARAGQRVLDLGTGVGTAALCLAARVPGVAVVGLEIQPAYAALAAENAAANGLADRVRVVQGDLLRPPAGLAPGAFDHVMANPPHLPAGSGHPPPDPAKAAANVEGEAALADWVAAALAMVRSRGTVTLVHRADRLDAVLAALHGRAGAIVACPLWPGPEPASRPAKRVIVQARAGVATPFRLSPGLVLHGPGGAFTAAAQAILRGGAGLDLGAALPDDGAQHRQGT
ncbi:MAG: methyltransferase [Hyphomicrobiales bacterium]|nr:methyltransferase [Hyphomicrobiales bacterium]